MNPLADVHGDLLIVRPPVPATVNKAGANYKSEVAHLDLRTAPRVRRVAVDPRRDRRVRRRRALSSSRRSTSRCSITRRSRSMPTARSDPAGSREALGTIDAVMTGRVFTANGPWVTRTDGGAARGDAAHARAPPRRGAVLRGAARRSSPPPPGSRSRSPPNPHRWEGMADVAAVGDRVILTYAVPGHYDAGTTPKSARSSARGRRVRRRSRRRPRGRADLRRARVPALPRRHGPLLRASPQDRGAGGPGPVPRRALRRWAPRSSRVRSGPTGSCAIDRATTRSISTRATRARWPAACWSRTGSSPGSSPSSRRRGLVTHRVPLFELFGKAGGGPACATLYLPAIAGGPDDAPGAILGQPRKGPRAPRADSTDLTCGSRLLRDPSARLTSDLPSGTKLPQDLEFACASGYHSAAYEMDRSLGGTGRNDNKGSSPHESLVPTLTCCRAGRRRRSRSCLVDRLRQRRGRRHRRHPRVQRRQRARRARRRDDAPSERNSALFGLRLGVFFGDMLGVEGEIGVIPSESRDAACSTSGT